MADAGRSLPLDLFEAGDPTFVDAIRNFHDADALANFAATWFEDPRPASRRLLLDYLDRPPNAYRHEGLVKRLFKRAEAVGDDEVMGRFLVLFDRSIRRVRRTRVEFLHQQVEDEIEAQILENRWRSLLYTAVTIWKAVRDLWNIHAHRTYEVIVNPRGTVMPRGKVVYLSSWNPTTRSWDRIESRDWAVRFRFDWAGTLNRADVQDLPDVRRKLEKLRLFSIKTRNYLRRRVWRYFRTLRESDPARYVAAMAKTLALYRDEDVADGLALLDNWGLVHALFHHCPAIEQRRDGWWPAPGRSLADLAPAPVFEDAWKAEPGAVVGLVADARSRTVRRWAIRRVEADPDSHRPALPPEGWLGLLDHPDPEVLALAANLLLGASGLESVGVDRWLALVESTGPDAIEVVCDLVARHVRAEDVAVGRAVRLATLRPLPVARLGLAWLRAKDVREVDPRILAPLVEADCGPLRPEILRWLRSAWAGSDRFEVGLILDLLDSRHADARAEGWAWFLAEPRAVDDVDTWQRLFESPYDDVRLGLVAELERREGPRDFAGKLDADGLRRLWASVLLNVHRGAKARPGVVARLADRLRSDPSMASDLLPLLGVALRSARGPERRAGLVAVVRLVDDRPEFAGAVRSAFPGLEFVGTG